MTQLDGTLEWVILLSERRFVMQLEIDQNKEKVMRKGKKEVKIKVSGVMGFLGFVVNGCRGMGTVIILMAALSEEVFTERVYIDPERLLRLKRQRKSLKLVPSIFEPPAQQQPSEQASREPSVSLTLKSRPKLQMQSNLSSEIVLRSRSANVEFIVGLLGEVRGQQVGEFQEGDTLNIRLDERWLLLQGELKVCGHNGHGYTMTEGYFFFVSAESKKKIKEVVCLRRSKVLRVSTHTYESFLKNYLFLKNAEKIKYLKYCPFFLWSDHLSEDLASCMSLSILDREDTIYSGGEHAQCIYFVKEGVVLLQRCGTVGSSLIREYQAHYEKEEVGESEATMIVKKGMVFGIDGILIKEHAGSNPNDSPESNLSRRRPNTRIYTAKTIGRSELYCIRREVLQTLFSESDLQATHNFPREMTRADLQRICADYADLVVRHRSLPKITQAVVRKDIVLSKREPSAGEETKRVNAKRIRMHEEAVKKLSIANIIPSRSAPKREEPVPENNASLLNQLNYKLALNEAVQEGSQPLAFPSLASNARRRKPKAHEENIDKYIFKWLKGSDPQRQERGVARASRGRQKQRRGELLINVRAYRSIIPLLA